MPLSGQGALFAAVGLAAVGGPALANPAAGAGSVFSTLGNVLGAWLPVNATVQPGTMVAAGVAVTGRGVLVVGGSAADLGGKLAAAMTPPQAPPAAAAASLSTWTSFAQGLITALGIGQVDPTGFVASPTGGPLTGAGVLTGLSTFDVAAAIGVGDATAKGVLLAFGGACLAFIETNAQVLPLPALASPNGGGPVTGVGSVV